MKFHPVTVLSGGLAGIVFTTAILNFVGKDAPVHAEPTPMQTVADPTTTDVYVLDGYNIRSYAEVDGKVFTDGTAWDEIYLINPRIEGERVYIPRNKYGREDGYEHFFFLDNLSKVKGRVYKLARPNITGFIAKDEPGLKIEEDGIEWDEDTILLNPEIHPNGGNRVFVPEWNLFTATGIPPEKQEKKHFFYRHNLVLVSHTN